MANIALIIAGGAGNRMRRNAPKQFYKDCQTVYERYDRGLDDCESGEATQFFREVCDETEGG